MGFRAGIVGLPNVGKSTLFNALTSAGAAASNFPFCTIEPNVGVVPVMDARLAEIHRLQETEKIVPTLMEFVDIAGLVRGASKGEGLGNQFLAKILEVDAIVHVVRCFEDSNIVHVDGAVDPVRDVQTIDTELVLRDLDSLDKVKQKIHKQVRAGTDKKVVKQFEAIELIEKHLNEGKPCRILKGIEELLSEVPDLRLLTAKKLVYVANVSVESLNKKNEYVEKLKALAHEEGSEVIDLCASIEAEIAELPENERRDYLQTMGLEESGLNRLVKKGYDLLGLISFFTCGPKEIRAWTIPTGFTAKKAAGVIHSDFERGFIRAEVIGYEDFISCGGELKAKEKGKLRLEGKEYIVHDADIMHFRFSV